MSWIFNGANQIVYSGNEGQAQYEAALLSYKMSELAPQYAGDRQRRFIAEGFCFIYNPMQ